MVLTIISFAVGVGNVEGFIISEIMPVYAKVRRAGHGIVHGSVLHGAAQHSLTVYYETMLYFAVLCCA